MSVGVIEQEMDPRCRLETEYNQDFSQNGSRSLEIYPTPPHWLWWDMLERLQLLTLRLVRNYD
jgi:hypothetical protein